jgi:hypothetical protein
MVRKKTQWISFHDDTNEKSIVRNVLSRRFGLHALQDEVLYFDKATGHCVAITEGYCSGEEILRKYFVHYPDLFCPQVVPQLVCEIDGDVHWQNTKAVHRTNARNIHYENAKLQFLWLTRDEVFKLDERELVKIITSRTEILPRLLTTKSKILNKNRKTKQSQHKG